jgi:holo-[acyl-carrier protein] synthase
VIVGVGIDVVDVGRFREVLERTPAVRARVFRKSEADRPISSLAARFAAKEALAKALGAPAVLRWLDVEVQAADSGRPVMALSGAAAQAAEALGVQAVHVSISHDAGIASAFVVLEA